MSSPAPGTSGSPNDDGSGENVISLDEYIRAEEELEEDAQAVLGGSDLQNCTYSQGYVTRQALYACSTCTPLDKPPAGICLACSLDCHDGHDLYELYTKRNFKCDCGNSLFETKCKLQAEKDDLNGKNKYNQNFKGVYCTCSRPYPDPDHEEDGEMIQCCLCEDWYHDNHLELSAPVPINYKEMICVGCVKLHKFLLSYANCGTKTDEDSEVDVTSDRKEVERTSQTQPCPKLDSSDIHPKTLFMPDGWRNDLCTCSDCMECYKSHELDFLLDKDDPTDVYEQKSKTSTSQDGTSYDKAMNAMSSLGRVQQVELIHGYNDMKENLAAYLKKFAENGKVVRTEDITEFFEEYSKNKRRRLAVPPSSCS